MSTPGSTYRLTPEDKRRIELIKHLSGYKTDTMVIREALRDKLERLQDKKGNE